MAASPTLPNTGYPSGLLRGGVRQASRGASSNSSNSSSGGSGGGSAAAGRAASGGSTARAFAGAALGFAAAPAHPQRQLPGASLARALQRAACSGAPSGSAPWAWGAPTPSSGAAGLCTHARPGLCLPAGARLARTLGGSLSSAATAGGSGRGGPCSGHGSLPLCAAGPAAPAPLLQAAGLTRNQLLRGGRKPKPARPTRTKALKGGPQRKGICVRVYTVGPKKPNSANRAIAKVALSTGVKVVAYVPGEGHNLQVRARRE
jgi:hypothetical protein